MARDFAKILTRVWDDPGWKALSTAEQSVYIGLLTTPDLSHCGVLPLLPQRVAGFAFDLNVAKVRRSFRSLSERNFVVLDQESAEIAVRSFVRNDETVSQPNMAKAMLKALRLVRSDRIRAAIIAELARAYAENPDLKGWPAVEVAEPEIWASIRE